MWLGFCGLLCAPKQIPQLVNSNGPFLSCRLPLENEYVFRLQGPFHANQTHFHMKGFARRLVLKQRHKGNSEMANRPFYSCLLCGLALNDSEAGVDLVLLHTSLLLLC